MTGHDARKGEASSTGDRSPGEAGGEREREREIGRLGGGGRSKRSGGWEERSKKLKDCVTCGPQMLVVDIEDEWVQ